MKCLNYLISVFRVKCSPNQEFFFVLKIKLFLYLVLIMEKQKYFKKIYIFAHVLNAIFLMIFENFLSS